MLTISKYLKLQLETWNSEVRTHSSLETREKNISIYIKINFNYTYFVRIRHLLFLISMNFNPSYLNISFAMNPLLRTHCYEIIDKNLFIMSDRDYYYEKTIFMVHWLTQFLKAINPLKSVLRELSWHNLQLNINFDKLVL